MSKRRKLVDMIPYDIVLTSEVAFEILKQAEVRDAMNFVIASGNDPRVRQIKAVMEQEVIWKYWMIRDLKIVMDLLPNQQLPKWAILEADRQYKASKKPHWKLAYLWYRITVSALQWNLINNQAVFMELYPPNSTLEFMYLNTLKLTIGGSPVQREEVMILDFRVEFIRIYNLLKSLQFTTRDPTDYTYDHFLDTFRSQPLDIRHFLSAKYDMSGFGNPKLYDTTPYVNLIDSILYSFGDDSLVVNNPTLRNPANIRDFPRLIEQTKILVGCFVCDKYIPKYKCSDCNMQLCGKCSVTEECYEHIAGKRKYVETQGLPQSSLLEFIDSGQTDILLWNVFPYLDIASLVQLSRSSSKIKAWFIRNNVWEQIQRHKYQSQLITIMGNPDNRITIYKLLKRIFAGRNTVNPLWGILSYEVYNSAVNMGQLTRFGWNDIDNDNIHVALVITNRGIRFQFVGDVWQNVFNELVALYPNADFDRNRNTITVSMNNQPRIMRIVYYILMGGGRITFLYNKFIGFGPKSISNKI